MEKCPYSGMIIPTPSAEITDIRDPRFMPAFRGSELWEAQKVERNNLAGRVIARAYDRFSEVREDYPPFGLLDVLNPNDRTAILLPEFSTKLPTKNNPFYKAKLSEFAEEVCDHVRDNYLFHLDKTLKRMAYARPSSPDKKEFRRFQQLTWRFETEDLVKMHEKGVLEDFEKDPTAWAFLFINRGVYTAFDNYLQTDNGVIALSKETLDADYLAKIARTSYPSLALLASADLNRFAKIHHELLTKKESETESPRHYDLRRFSLTTQNEEQQFSVDREYWKAKLAEYANIQSPVKTRCPAIKNFTEFDHLPLKHTDPYRNTIEALLNITADVLTKATHPHTVNAL